MNALKVSLYTPCRDIEKLHTIFNLFQFLTLSKRKLAVSKIF